MSNTNNMRKDVKIIVAAHKQYQMPTDKIYMPVQVGAEGKQLIGYTPDNTGDNISNKNANYCELTGLYWLWKNTMDDVVGLVHYRQILHFEKDKSKMGLYCIRKANPYDAEKGPYYPAEKA